MAVDRAVWRKGFVQWPALPCPSCSIGNLKPGKDAVRHKETKSSLKLHGHDAWEPDWIEGRFSAELRCTNPACKDHVFVCGKTGMDFDYYYGPNGNYEQALSSTFEPQYFEPAPPIFPIPKQCPDEVRSELTRAFGLIWVDHGSSANSLRIAVETLLDEQGIQRRAKIKSNPNKGKFRVLTLHERIERFGNSEPEALTQLMALKWLGNAGSHKAQDQLTREDLLDAFEHFEFALELIYVRHTQELNSRAKKIIKEKGPVRKSPRKSK